MITSGFHTRQLEFSWKGKPAQTILQYQFINIILIVVSAYENCSNAIPVENKTQLFWKIINQ